MSAFGQTKPDDRYERGATFRRLERARISGTRYDDEAMLESARHAHELVEDGDRAGAATRLRITNAVDQLANTTAPGTVH